MNATLTKKSISVKCLLKANDHDIFTANFQQLFANWIEKKLQNLYLLTHFMLLVPFCTP